MKVERHELPWFKSAWLIELSNGILCPSHDSFLNLQCLENTADLWQVKWQTFSHKDLSQLESNQALRGTVILKHVLRPLSHWGFFVTDKYRTFILSCRFAMESKKMPNIFFLGDAHTFHGFLWHFSENPRILHGHEHMSIEFLQWGIIV